MESNKASYDKVIQKPEHLKSILCTKEKIDETNRQIMKIVESLIEDSVSESELIDACKVLCQKEYEDVNEERSILQLCGYPLCSNPVKVTSQIYHIVQEKKKVFDISDRRKFCSNRCYTASNFLKLQIPDTPPWAREDVSTVELFSEEKNCDIKPSYGVDVVMSLKDTKPMIPKVDQMPFYQETKETKKVMLSQEVEEQTKGLKNPASFFENQHSFKVKFDSDDSTSESGDNGSVSDGDYHAFEPQTATVQSSKHYSEKYMPEFKSDKRLILIDAMPLKKPETSNNLVGIEFAFKILQEWMTLNSLTFLLGEEHVQKFREKFLKPECSQADKNTKQLGPEYNKFCSKIETMFIEEEKMDKNILEESKQGNIDEKVEITAETMMGQNMLSFVKRMPSDDSQKDELEKNTVGNLEGQQKIPIRKKRTKKPKEKLFIVERKNKNTKQMEQSNSEERFLPLVDTFSQNTQRLQVVLRQLRLAYLALLPSIDMSYQNISQEFRDFATTFKFSATNVIFKPAEWKLLALVTLRMLKYKFNACEESQFSHLLTSLPSCKNITVSVIDEYITRLIDLETMQRQYLS